MLIQNQSMSATLNQQKILLWDYESHKQTMSERKHMKLLRPVTKVQKQKCGGNQKNLKAVCSAHSFTCNK